MPYALSHNLTTALAADRRRQLLAEAEAHRLASLAARRRRQLRQRRHWATRIRAGVLESA